MNKLIVIAVSGMLLLEMMTSTRAELLYNVAFSTPDDVVGAQISSGALAGAPRDRVSLCPMGEQIVRSSFGLLTTQPAEFIAAQINPFASHKASGIDLNMQGLSFLEYNLEFDAWMGEATQGSYLFFAFDSLWVGASFSADGGMWRSITGNGTAIGTFDPAQILHVGVTVNSETRAATLLVNGIVAATDLRTGDIQQINPLQHIFVGFNSSVQGDSIGIDNINVYGIPEPATLLLLALGGIALRARKRM